MTCESDAWSAWRERFLLAVVGGGSLAESVCEVAEQISVACGSAGPVAQRWTQVGIDVRQVRMYGRGRCDISDRQTPVVYVNEADNEYAQQFTVAHEVAHLLLSTLPSERLSDLSHRGEEDLCDGFARRVIVPPKALAEALAGEVSPSPERLLQLCGEFKANPSTMLRAIAGQVSLDDTTYLLARLKRHYRRPTAVGFRIAGATGPDAFFWPFETRIESVGLANLSVEANNASHGAYFEGCEERVVVGFRRVTTDRENAAAGPARWQAARQGRSTPYLLARVDCSQMRWTRVKTRASRSVAC